MQSTSNLAPQRTSRTHPTPAEMEWHLANGRRLQSQAMIAAVTMVGGWIRKGTRSVFQSLSGTNRSSDEAATALRPPLATIRSSAEALRDNPDLPPAERARLVESVLSEEQRLADLLGRTVGSGAKLLGPVTGRA